MLAMSAAEFGSTGAVAISWFHGLSTGNGRRPPRLAPGPSPGAASVRLALPPAVAAAAGPGPPAPPPFAKLSSKKNSTRHVIIHGFIVYTPEAIIPSLGVPLTGSLPSAGSVNQKRLPRPTS